MANFKLGIIGSGQLGRMTVQAASDYGISCHIFSPDTENSPAGQVCNAFTTGEYTDEKALRKFYNMVDAVVCEFENVPVTALEMAPEKILVSPGIKALATAQNRLDEKDTARFLGIPTTPYWRVKSTDDLINAMNLLNGEAILKTAKFGYDGKGQIRAHMGDNFDSLWQQINTELAILETLVDFKKEISILIARTIEGAIKCFPPTINHHENGILVHSTAPAILPSRIVEAGYNYAKLIADHLEIVGLLTIELFLLEENTLIFNEIAPRPHNSFHWTIEGCKTSQFHQLVRCVSGLPLGDVSVDGRWHMENILGQTATKISSGYHSSGNYVHEYGKAETKTNRKMGHITWKE